MQGLRSICGLLLPQVANLSPPHGSYGPCYISDTTNKQVQDDNFYPEARALTGGVPRLTGFEEYRGN